MSLSLAFIYVITRVICYLRVGFVAVEAMDISFMSGLMSKVNTKITAAKSFRPEEETAGNYDHRQDEGVSSRVSTKGGKRNEMRQLWRKCRDGRGMRRKVGLREPNLP